MPQLGLRVRRNRVIRHYRWHGGVANLVLPLCARTSARAGVAQGACTIIFLQQIDLVERGKRKKEKDNDLCSIATPRNYPLKDVRLC